MDDRHELDALRAEVAALRDELADMRPTPLRDGPMTRRGLLMGLAGAGAAGVASLAGASPAGADDGDTLVLGEENASMATTTVGHAAADVGAPAVVVQSSGRFALDARTSAGSSGEVPFAEGCAIAGRAHGTFESWSHGVWGVSDFGFGVLGSGESYFLPGVVGINGGTGPGLGATSEGHGAQIALYLEDDPASGPPPGYCEVGYVRLDSERDLWLCVDVDGTGTGGTWTRVLREDTAVGRVVSISPVRALDTRVAGGRPPGAPAVPGQKQGPLKGGTALTLDLAGAGPIPASASGVVGNLTVVSPSYAGFLIARPSGAAATTSSLNFPAGVAALANAFTSRLGPAGLTISGSGTSANTYHLIVDITAYIT